MILGFGGMNNMQSREINALPVCFQAWELTLSWLICRTFKHQATPPTWNHVTSAHKRRYSYGSRNHNNRSSFRFFRWDNTITYRGFLLFLAPISERDEHISGCILACWTILCFISFTDTLAGYPLFLHIIFRETDEIITFSVLQM